MRSLIAILFIFISSPIWADEPVEGLTLSEAPIQRSNVDSIKRGAKFFAANCMSCHTMIYFRYDKLGQEAGIAYEKMPVNVKTWPNGVTPPDLSSEADVRGVDWIYTYLHSFYSDPTRPTGANNLLVPGTAMPNIVGPFQGEQVLVKNYTYDLLGQVRWFDLVKLTKQGMMTPEQFDATIGDLVNFLAYASEPYRAEQHKIGWWVLSFLVLLFVMMVMLKKEYWKDVKKNKHELK